MHTSDKVVAAVLAFFLGGLGIHRFYLNQPLLGVLYLLFCWTFIPAIIAFIDAIVFLCMSDEEFDAKYNQPKVYKVAIQVPDELKEKSSKVKDLQNLFYLKEKKIITEEEFEKEKAKIFKEPE